MIALMLLPWSVLAASVPNFPPNPVGEKLYRGQLFRETLLPVVILVCALVAVGIVHLVVRKRHRLESP